MAMIGAPYIRLRTWAKDEPAGTGHCGAAGRAWHPRWPRQHASHIPTAQRTAVRPGSFTEMLCSQPIRGMENKNGLQLTARLQLTCIKRKSPIPIAGPSNAETITMIMGLTNMTHPALRHATPCRHFAFKASRPAPARCSTARDIYSNCPFYARAFLT